jgi:hypothetical protein
MTRVAAGVVDTCQVIVDVDQQPSSLLLSPPNTRMRIKIIILLKAKDVSSKVNSFYWLSFERNHHRPFI